MRTISACVAVALLTFALAGCGGGSTESAASYAPPEKAEYELELLSKIGIRQAFVTVTTGAGGLDVDTTDVIFDFYVPLVDPGLADDVYAVGMYEGTCGHLGELTHSFGDLGAGITTVAIEEPFDRVVGALDSGDAPIAIHEPDGTLAWCGP